jgi:repressor of nif and glnA expression
MTDYRGAIRTGNGRIGASFRDMPADSRELVVILAERLRDVGLGAFSMIGLPGQALLGVPVSEGRIGAVVVGGLNPISIIEEAKIRVVSKAMSGLLEYNRLYSYEELPQRLKMFL